MRNEKLKDCLDDALSGIQENPWLYQQVLHRAEREENTQMKKKLSFSFVSVIAILLVLVAVAYAATEVYHRIRINWKGETVEETEVPIGPEATVVPPLDAQILSDEDLSRMADELLQKSVAEDEYGWVSYETAGGKMGGARSIQKTFDSWDEFREYMNRSSELTLPTWIPDGYEFQEAKVGISCKADGKYTLIEERQEGAITLKRYKIDDSDSVVVWYYIDYKESGEDQEADERTFDLTDGQSASVITVPGIDDALAIVRNDPAYNSLAMRRNLNHSIECRMDPMYAEAPVPIEPAVLTCENIDVSSPWLDIETLQKIFTPE